MINVRLSTSVPGFPFLRQTPNGDGVWGNCRFIIDEPLEACEFWVVIDGVPDAQTCLCSPLNTLFIASEPSSVKTYREGFLDQFAAIWTTHPGQAGHNAIQSPPYLPWHIGIDWHSEDPAASAADFEAVKSYLPAEKTRSLSVITSDKSFTPWHARRIEFVEQLKHHFGDRIDVFGRGIRDIGDKAEAILPYRYHIALENSFILDYWTEKLSDTFLGGAFPIYWGCQNADSYFPKESFARVDLNDVDSSIDVIEGILQADPYEDFRPFILKSRDLALYDYNLFNVLSNYISSKEIGEKKERLILPERYFSRKISTRRMFKKTSIHAYNLLRKLNK